MFAGNFAPLGWAFCNGAPVQISDNATLFQLIGTTYGGDGQTTYNLPDLRGRVPIHMGTGGFGTTFIIGETAGAEGVTLALTQMPATGHTHTLNATTAAATSHAVAGDVVPAKPTAVNAKLYTTQGASPTIEALSTRAVGAFSGGGVQPHENRMPVLAINFIISLFGIFPSQT